MINRIDDYKNLKKELEFLLTILADAKYKLKDVPRILEITKKLQSEYKLVKEHSNE